MPSVLSDSSVEHRDSTKASSSSGVSSDCSDSDHEIDDLTGAGKFKSRSSDVYDYHIEVSTQTDVSLEEQKSMEIDHLNLEIEKLTKFKHSIEARKTPDHMALEELDDLRVSHNSAYLCTIQVSALALSVKRAKIWTISVFPCFELLYLQYYLKVITLRWSANGTNILTIFVCPLHAAK